MLYLGDMNETVSIEAFQALQALYQAQAQELAMVKHELEQLKKLIFGSKREYFKPSENAEQLALGFEGVQAQEPAPVATETISYSRKKNANHKGRQPLPDHLPVEEIIIEPQEDITGLKHIGDEVTETVDYTPGILLKRRYIRRKYARVEPIPGQSEVVIGSLPYRPIAKGIAESGLLAYLLVSKYVDHLPFYRQIEKFKREHDWNIQKSTLNDWFAACCTLLDPLYKAHKHRVLSGGYLQADESPIKVLDNTTAKKTHKGYMWVYRNPESRLVLFDYQQGRGAEHPLEVLGSFKGLLQCDGYNAYTSLSDKRKDIRLVSCLAHIRRKFFEALSNHRSLAEHALGLIQQLYALEQEYRQEGLSAQEKAMRRTEQARPIYEALSGWVSEQHVNNLSKEAIGKALLYASKELPQLEIYLSDGRVEIDNNLIENAIRPMAIGRKNYLFCGSHDAGERAAIMYSFFASCKTMDINPWEWLRDILQRLESHPHKQIEELLPGNWKPASTSTEN
jgi:transposase